MPDSLIGVITCKKDSAWMAACRETWLKDVDAALFDIVEVDDRFVPPGLVDSYALLPQKTKLLCSYALKHSYRHLFKIDCDSFCRPRLLDIPTRCDYAGRRRGRSAPDCVPAGVKNNSDFCSGGAYWLSFKAMQIIAQSPHTNDIAEDRFVGNTLAGYGIHPAHLSGYVAPTCWPPGRYLNDPGTIVLMQLRDLNDPANAFRMHNYYKGVLDPPTLPAGSNPSHYPPGSVMRRQM